MLFRRAAKLPHRGRVFVRRDRGEFIVACIVCNRDGIHFEHGEPVRMRGVDPVEIGETIRRIASGTRMVDADIRHWKKTDWPAFRVSGAKSVRQFEADYVCVEVAGASAANATYQLSVHPESPEGLEISFAVNPLLSRDMGTAVLRLVEILERRRF